MQQPGRDAERDDDVRLGLAKTELRLVPVDDPRLLSTLQLARWRRHEWWHARRRSRQRIYHAKIARQEGVRLRQVHQRPSTRGARRVGDRELSLGRAPECLEKLARHSAPLVRDLIVCLEKELVEARSVPGGRTGAHRRSYADRVALVLVLVLPHRSGEPRLERRALANDHAVGGHHVRPERLPHRRRREGLPVEHSPSREHMPAAVRVQPARPIGRF